MKYILQWFVFLLPFHAIFVTYMKCKVWVDTDILRFWKEIGILFFLSFIMIRILCIKKIKIPDLYKNNYLLWISTAFIISSCIYIFFPYFTPKINAYLWFKYDVFFIFALIIWLYLWEIKKHFHILLQTLFVSAWIMLILFLPWYLFWDISQTTSLIWYSQQPSTYEANSCISFSQNVSGWYHRFQWSFWDPIIICFLRRY